MERYYSTGEVARLCGISPRTVVNYCDQGRIENIQSSVTGYRRISRESLLKFLAANGLPQSLAFREEALTALIAEDSQADRILMMSALARAFPQMRTEAVADGYEALLRIGEAPPTLLVLDLRLPILDGMEVCRRLLKNPRTRGVTILPVTGFEAEEVRSRVVDLGIPEVLVKSADVQAFRDGLVSAVSRLLDIEPTPPRKASQPSPSVAC